MEKNAGYTILRSVLFENGRGFALGESTTAPSPFVTWQFTEEQGKRDYYWGFYHQSLAAAEQGFAARADDYRHSYGVREVKRPIAEQMREAKTLTDGQQDPAAPKKDIPGRNNR